MISFVDFFRTATRDERGVGQDPHGFQRRVADQGLPDALEAPTGVGKTAGTVLPWLWRQRHADPQATPRRLVFALPQRSLVEQVAGEVAGWLGNLGLTDDVALHVVMGGAGQSQHEWRMAMDRPAIVVGTVDSLVSKALNRAYAVGRSIFPIDFALVTNDAHWVIDEIQLCPESTTTLRQLQAFTRRWPTARPFGLTCMTATVPEGLLDTVDNPWPGDGRVCRIEPADRVGVLEQRLAAARTIGRLPVDGSDVAGLAAAVRQRHRPGTLTLVVVNTVKTARELKRSLDDEAVLLLHSRFRGVEREGFARQLRDIHESLGEAGRIVVATQVVECGIDLDSATLITEVAPWPSLVQRAGRCNRRGARPDARMWWYPPAKANPYDEADLAASAAQLTALEGRPVTGEDLLACEVAATVPRVTVLRRPDLLTLFDTSQDLSGSDLDVAPYVRDAEDSDVQLVWARWPADAAPDGRLPKDARWRCRAPIGAAHQLLRRASGWRWNQQEHTWDRVPTGSRLRAGDVLLVNAADGGYDPVLGFDPGSRAPVADAPALEGQVDRAGGGEDGFGEDDPGLGWLPLDVHGTDTAGQAEALVAAIGPALPDGIGDVVRTAALLHDTGKCHHIFQDAVIGLAPEGERADLAAGGPWAKSGHKGMLRYGGTRFRHELVSLLLLDGPLHDLIADLADPDLARYLVLAHHGKLRLQVREPADPKLGWDPDVLLGLRAKDTVPVPAMLGRPATELTISLDQFVLGGERSWTRAALDLRDRYGPFLLAYLETLVRIADWRASANPTTVTGGSAS